MGDTLLFLKLLFDGSFVRGTSADVASVSVRMISPVFALFSAILALHAVQADHSSFSL